MAQRKTVLSPLFVHVSYLSFVLNHWYYVLSNHHKLECSLQNKYIQGPLYLTQINFDPNMDN